MGSNSDSARALLATIQAGQQQINALVHQHLPVDRALSFSAKHSGTARAEQELLDVVGAILNREVDIWRRSFAARVALYTPPSADQPAAAASAAEEAPSPPPAVTEAVAVDEPDSSAATTQSEAVPEQAEAAPEQSEAAPEQNEAAPEQEEAAPEQSEAAPEQDGEAAAAVESTTPSIDLDEDELELELDSEDTMAEDDDPEATLPGHQPSPLEDLLAAAPEAEELDDFDEEFFDQGQQISSGQRGDDLHEDELRRLVLEGVDLSAELGSDESVDDSLDEDAAIEHLLSGPDPLDELPATEGQSETIRIATGEELELGLDNITKESDVQQEDVQDIRQTLDDDDLMSFDDESILADTIPAHVPAEEESPAETAPVAAVVATEEHIVADTAPDEDTQLGGPMVFVPQPEAAATEQSDDASPKSFVRPPRSASARRGRPSLSRTPSLFDEEEEEEESRPSGVASIQLLGGLGNARTMGHTLELGGLEDDDSEEILLDTMVDGSGEMSVTFEEAYEEAEAIPQLTETAAPAPVRSSEPSPEPPADANTVETLLQQAQKSKKQGNIQQAIVHYGDLIDLDPLNTDARLARGRCLMEMADFAAAMSDFQRAEELQPTSATPPFEMGNLFYTRKDYRRAIPFYTQAINIDPELVLARVRRGMSFFYRQEHQKALTDLEHAQLLEPEIPGLTASINKVRRALRQ